MDSATRRAVMAAARREAAGNPVSIGDTGFWQPFGLPTIDQRSDILTRANILVNASELILSDDWTGPLTDLFSGTPYPADGGSGGPLETTNARVFTRIGFTDARGNTVYRSWAGSYPWGTDLGEILSDIVDAISDMEGGYGISDGYLVGESILIY